MGNPRDEEVAAAFDRYIHESKKKKKKKKINLGIFRTPIKSFPSLLVSDRLLAVGGGPRDVKKNLTPTLSLQIFLME
jgi:hypothetical protein